MTLNRSIPQVLVGVLAATGLAACGSSSTTSNHPPPNAAGSATTAGNVSTAQAPSTPSPTAAGQPPNATALANRVAARFGPVARQCQGTSRSQADFVSCLNAHGVQMSIPSEAQAKLDSCLKHAHDATALVQCTKLVGAP